MFADISGRSHAAALGCFTERFGLGRSQKQRRMQRAVERLGETVTRRSGTPLARIPRYRSLPFTTESS